MNFPERLDVGQRTPLDTEVNARIRSGSTRLVLTKGGSSCCGDCLPTASAGAVAVVSRPVWPWTQNDTFHAALLPSSLVPVPGKDSRQVLCSASPATAVSIILANLCSCVSGILVEQVSSFLLFSHLLVDLRATLLHLPPPFVIPKCRGHNQVSPF